MTDTLTRIVSDLLGRVEGPFAFRFVLQPLMAVIYAILDGLTDARQGKPPYLRTILTRPDLRRKLLREGCYRVARLMLLGVVMDLLYQFIVFKTLYPFELIVIVLVLAFLPYVLLRGPITRIARRWEATKRHA